MTIQVDANLFRLVYGAVSTEETRYYLNGVHIEAHPSGGAIVVATDGHRLIAAHDPNGVCDQHLIVQLPKGALSRCKPAKDTRLRLIVDADAKSATINEVIQPDDPTAAPIIKVLTTEHDVLIDGTFPDWRRVVPTKEQKPAGAKATFFNPQYLKDLATVGVDIAKTIGGTGAVQIALSDGGSPVIVRWVGCDALFGVLMPVRAEVNGILPAFMNSAFKAAAE